MGKRSIFFRNLERKKLVFPLFISLAVILNLNTNFGKKVIYNTRISLLDITNSISSTFYNLTERFSNLLYFFSHDINNALLDLHRENIRLSYEIENLKHLQTENNELRQILALKQQLSVSESENDQKNNTDTIRNTCVVAKVTSMFSNDYVRSCKIDLGSNDGISIDDIVRDKNGIIGRISDVQPTWSNVLLITDRNSKLPVKIGDQQINAIISGNNSDLLEISMKNEDKNIKEIDNVETAYLGTPFCEKIPVGKVKEKNGSFFICPFVDFNNIKYVCVLKNK